MSNLIGRKFVVDGITATVVDVFADVQSMKIVILYELYSGEIGFKEVTSGSGFKLLSEK